MKGLKKDLPNRVRINWIRQVVKGSSFQNCIQKPLRSVAYFCWINC